MQLLLNKVHLGYEIASMDGPSEELFQQKFELNTSDYSEASTYWWSIYGL